METNMSTTIKKELQEKGQALLNAAYEFWQVHQKLAGPRAVVWLKGTDGHFVLFTRGEYLSDIMRSIVPMSEETPLDEPFTI